MSGSGRCSTVPDTVDEEDGLINPTCEKESDSPKDRDEARVRRQSVIERIRNRMKPQSSTEGFRDGRVKSFSKKKYCSCMDIGRKDPASPNVSSNSQLIRAKSDVTGLKLKIPCPVCFICDIDGPHSFQIASCGCKVCIKCLQTHIEKTLVDAKEICEIKCPVPKCTKNGVLSFDEIENILRDNTSSDSALYKFQLLRCASLSEENAFICCTPGCHYTVNVTEEKKENTSSNSWITCYHCSTKYCWTCKIPLGYHGNDTTCNKAKEFLQTMLDQPEIGTKFCPKCGENTKRLKNSPANIQCSSCNHKWCWICSRSLNGDEFLTHYTSGFCSGKLNAKQPKLWTTQMEASLLVAGGGILLLASTPLLLVGLPVYAATMKTKKFLKRRRSSQRADSIREGGELEGIELSSDK